MTNHTVFRKQFDICNVDVLNCDCIIKLLSTHKNTKYNSIQCETYHFKYMRYMVLELLNKLSVFPVNGL